MPVIVDYNSLVQSIVDAAEDDGTEFANYIPVSIDLAEERLIKDLDLIDLEQKITGSLTANSNTVSKPNDYKLPHFMNITVGTVKRLLKNRKEDYLIDYWPDAAQVGAPKYYSDSAFGIFSFAPTPDQNYQYQLKYLAQPPKLSTTNTTNYYTAQCKDLLYFASMIEQTQFMKAWDQVKVWESRYQQEVDAWNMQAARKRRDDGETPNNPNGGDNTLKHTSKSNA